MQTLRILFMHELTSMEKGNLQEKRREKNRNSRHGKATSTRRECIAFVYILINLSHAQRLLLNVMM